MKRPKGVTITDITNVPVEACAECRADVNEPCVLLKKKRQAAALAREPTDEEVARELEAAAREVWISVPSSYDDHDPAVLRHAAALNALGAILTRLEANRGK